MIEEVVEQDSNSSIEIVVRGFGRKHLERLRLRSYAINKNALSFLNFLLIAKCKCLRLTKVALTEFLE